MKKGLKIIGVLILILILFRGVVFRLAIKYYEIGSRPDIEITNRELTEKIESKSQKSEIDLKEILEIADKITKEELTFTTKQTSNNPNELINTKRANCVGYSAMFNSVANHLIKKNKLGDEIEAEHKVGQLELFGINLHQFFESPFFRDHDFNKITNKKTEAKFFIDPIVSDYLWIKRVAKKRIN